jgi:hypothetical protein
MVHKSSKSNTRPVAKSSAKRGARANKATETCITAEQVWEPHAASTLSNLLGVAVQGEKQTSRSVVPGVLINALLADEDLWRELPVIKTYARRAVFDHDFTLCGPGWHPNRGILVHGPDISPVQLPPVVVRVNSIDQFPPSHVPNSPNGRPPHEFSNVPSLWNR